MLRVILFILVLASTNCASAQYRGGYRGGYGMPYRVGQGGFGGYGMGFGRGMNYGGYGGMGNYAFNYSNQLYQQQASLTQQIFQQQQQMLIDQIRDAQNRVARLDAIKQEMFQEYLNMSESDKATTRNGLMNDYINLDEHTREGWRRDEVVKIIIGNDIKRLEGVIQYRQMNSGDQLAFRQVLLQKYKNLSPSEKEAWQADAIMTGILGKDWWK